MVVPPAHPDTTAELGPTETGGARKLLLDELLAERGRPPLPPEPVFSVEPVAVDATPIGSGRRAARKRLTELEALARRNLRSAEEARRVVHEERRLLEEEASARTHAEQTAATLRRELERMRSTDEQRAAQAQFAATHEARATLAGEIERVHEEHTRVVDELDRLRGTLFDHDSLLDEYSQRLHEEQQGQAIARGELVRAEEGRRTAERNLEIATETARRRAEDELARFTKVEEALRETRIERDRVTAELNELTTGDGELARLRADVAATHEDMARLLADLDVHTVRADTAETDLTAMRDACAQAERVAADAVAARDEAWISLETTRSELAERSEALDAEKATAQTRIADLSAQLTMVTRTAENATEQLSDLERRLDAAITAREASITRSVGLGEQLERAVSDAEQLRTHAASIGDELAATHLALDDARRELAARPTVAAETSAYAPAEVSYGPVSAEPAFDLPPSAVSPFDAALASAFGEPIDAAAAREPASSEAIAVEPPDIEPSEIETNMPVSIFRTVEADPGPAVRAGGPVVDAEAALVRELIPPESGETGEERSPEVETWRRTAMAELTALATDSDDFTPRRRR